jgi:hypothetical protein
VENLPGGSSLISYCHPIPKIIIMSLAAKGTQNKVSVGQIQGNNLLTQATASFQQEHPRDIPTTLHIPLMSAEYRRQTLRLPRLDPKAQMVPEKISH